MRRARSEAARATTGSHAKDAGRRLQQPTIDARPAASPADRIVALQRTAGNRAVEQFLHARGTADQLRLASGTGADEREAVEVAATIGRGRSESGSLARTSGERPQGDRALSAAAVAEIREATSGGQPLPRAVRATLEPQLGLDLGHVRVHAGSGAARSAKALGARAYTVGADLVFGANQYAPRSAKGQALIAHEATHAAQQGAGGQVVQRDPDDSGEIQSYVFGGDKKLKTDKKFAEQKGREIAERLRKAGELTRDLHLELNGMLAFFDDDAYDAYVRETKPALVRVTAGKKVEAIGTDDSQVAAKARPAGSPKADAPLNPTAFSDRMFGDDKYFDNHIKEVHYYTAEQIDIDYYDGTTLRIGLVPRWIEPPFAEVDYHTPADQFRQVATPKSFGFIRKDELRDIQDPRKIPEEYRQLTFQDILDLFSTPVDFYAKGGHIVPSHINAITAPNLTKVLLDSEKRFEEQVKWGAEWGTKVAGVVGWMGAGNWRGVTAAPMSAAGRYIGGRLAASRAIRNIGIHLEGALEAGAAKTFTVEGIEFGTVRAVERSGVLEVSRHSIENISGALGKARVVNSSFEEAAIALAKSKGLKTVTINVGHIVNDKWAIYLKSIGYVRTQVEKTVAGGSLTSWEYVKTITM
jgi:hypothetical protein